MVQVVTEALEESVDEARILKEEGGRKRTAWRLGDGFPGMFGINFEAYVALLH